MCLFNWTRGNITSKTGDTKLKEERIMGFIWALIVGGIIGWLAGLIAGRDMPGGVIGNIIAGFIGEMCGFYIIPALIGSIILVFVVSFVMRKMRSGRTAS